MPRHLHLPSIVGPLSVSIIENCVLVRSVIIEIGSHRYHYCGLYARTVIETHMQPTKKFHKQKLIFFFSFLLLIRREFSLKALAVFFLFSGVRFLIFFRKRIPFYFSNIYGFNCRVICWANLMLWEKIIQTKVDFNLNKTEIKKKKQEFPLCSVRVANNFWISLCSLRCTVTHTPTKQMWIIIYQNDLCTDHDDHRHRSSLVRSSLKFHFVFHSFCSHDDFIDFISKLFFFIIIARTQIHVFAGFTYFSHSPAIFRALLHFGSRVKGD